MSRAIVLESLNESTVNPVASLKLVTKALPQAAEPGQVVVHITLRPINPTDLLTIRTGRYSGRAVRTLNGPPTPGSEGFGIVHAVGEGVTKVKPGQRVVPLLYWGSAREGEGSWQEYVSVRQEMVWPVPDSISDETAAQFVIGPWTAYGLLHDLAVPKGEYVLQTAAGSVLGRQVIQLAKHWGIKTINIVRRSEQKEELKALGADEVISSNDEDVVARVKEITGNRLAYGALDAVGGELTKEVCASVRSGGQVFVYGVLASYDAVVGILDLIRPVHLTGWSIFGHFDTDDKPQSFIDTFSDEVSKLLDAKIIQPLAGEKFDLADFKTAIRRSEEAGRAGGKVLLAS